MQTFSHFDTSTRWRKLRAGWSTRSAIWTFGKHTPKLGMTWSCVFFANQLLVEWPRRLSRMPCHGDAPFPVARIPTKVATQRPVTTATKPWTKNALLPDLCWLYDRSNPSSWRWESSWKLQAFLLVDLSQESVWISTLLLKDWLRGVWTFYTKTSRSSEVCERSKHLQTSKTLMFNRCWSNIETLITSLSVLNIFSQQN